MVPPPTRRCTLDVFMAIFAAGGSSAHAEMHPARRSRGALGAWFLRPRGDAPPLITATPKSSWVPPPTRRCTLDVAGHVGRPDGSSAHAEMHPHAAPDRAALVGFLRPRGDAPYTLGTPHARDSVPPPTRRCTSAGSEGPRRPDGSSAHAEMHRSATGARARCSWFLRPRGDAPQNASRPTSRVTVPPPTRRCTSRMRSDRAARRGSSAHAEMHPGTASTSSTRTGFLRPRGDAPGPLDPRQGKTQVPPPTRRCTPPGFAQIFGRAGSSAHAEMHPRTRSAWTTSPRFLRPRGDAPSIVDQTGWWSQVPPPTRRCTAIRVRVRPQLAGSSAHAEMHPTRTDLRSRSRGFLRPRGDAPAVRRRLAVRAPVPPPTRRCTLHARFRRCRLGGSSAHAEMHPRSTRPR